jgi:hypothetical protein
MNDLARSLQKLKHATDAIVNTVETAKKYLYSYIDSLNIHIGIVVEFSNQLFIRVLDDINPQYLLPVGDDWEKDYKSLKEGMKVRLVYRGSSLYCFSGKSCI